MRTHLLVTMAATALALILAAPADPALAQQARGRATSPGPDRYLMVELFPESLSSLTSDAWHYHDGKFLLIRNHDYDGRLPSARQQDPPGRRGRPDEQPYKAAIGRVSDIHWTYMKDNRFMSGVMKAAPIVPGRWREEFLNEMLNDAVESFSSYTVRPRATAPRTVDLAGHRALLIEMPYFSERDGIDLVAVFAAWTGAESRNAFVFLGVTVPDNAADGFALAVAGDLIDVGDDIILPASGDPLKGLNVSCAPSGCDSADGKTVSVPFSP